jgi:hypothetical protein
MTVTGLLDSGYQGLEPSFCLSGEPRRDVFERSVPLAEREPVCRFGLPAEGSAGVLEEPGTQDEVAERPGRRRFDCVLAPAPRCRPPHGEASA